MNNEDQVTGYHVMAEEIWTQTGGKIDAFVQSVGTSGPCAATPKACAAVMKKSESSPWSPLSPRCSRAASRARARLMASGRALWYRSGSAAWPIRLNGSPTTDAVAMALRMAREEGVFAGTSTGANVTAALRLAGQLGPHATIVTVMVDTGMKYLKNFGAEVRL